MYIFLDIDGVLNKKEDWKHPFVLNDENMDVFNMFLKRINNPRIILISSWRKGFVSPGNKNNAPYIKELEDRIRYGRVVGKISDTITDRQKGIEMFLSEHPGDYIVFDDDKTEYKYEQDNLVLINCNTGLTTKDVKGVK